MDGILNHSPAQVLSWPSGHNLQLLRVLGGLELKDFNWHMHARQECLACFLIGTLPSVQFGAVRVSVLHLLAHHLSPNQVWKPGASLDIDKHRQTPLG